MRRARNSGVDGSPGLGTLEVKVLRIRGRCRVTYWGPGGCVGRRVTLTGPQLVALGEGLRRIRHLDDALALAGIWRQASEKRNPAAFVAMMLQELAALPASSGEPVYFHRLPT
jgi:hypothetical protein